MNGKFDDSFQNLIHLEALHIINGEQVYEGVENNNQNVLDINAFSFPSVLTNMANLIELNLVGISLKGNLPLELLKLNRLRYLNLSENKLLGSIPSDNAWL